MFKYKKNTNSINYKKDPGFDINATCQCTCIKNQESIGSWKLLKPWSFNHSAPTIETWNELDSIDTVEATNLAANLCLK